MADDANDNNNDNNNWAAEINGAQDDDEALRIAIALSLGQDPGAQQRTDRQTSRQSDGPQRGVIDLTGEDDDDDDFGGGDVDRTEEGRARVTAGGTKPAPSQQGVAGTETTAATTIAATSETQPTGISAFAALGLDRKRMEEERLARVSKRKAGVALAGDGDGDVVPPLRPARRAKTADGEAHSPAPAPLPLAGSTGKTAKELEHSTMTVPSLSSGSSSTVPARLPFPRGVVKKTWAFGQPRLGDDIKIEEVLQKHKLELAVLSSYQWDEEWLLSKVDLSRTKLILIAFATDEKQKEDMRSNVPRDRVRFCFPPMQTMGSMHSKLQLLKYQDYMRIVVPTANLMSFDWGETGSMENMVFIIDLPKFRTAEEREAQELTPFADELFYFLRAQGLDEKLVSSLRNYDFAETRRYAFVHTIAGSHTAEEAWKRTGYCGLGRGVTGLGLDTSQTIEVDYVCATIGAINNGHLTALYRACQGDSGLKEYETRTVAGGKSRAGSSKGDDVTLVKAHMRVFFPSRETVLRSRGGPNGAGIICLPPKWWRAPSFPREVLRDCVSVRPGLLMHSKVIYVRSAETSPADSISAAGRFAYVGSANLSESAWGRLVRDRATGKPKLNCRNWECGVLVRTGEAREVPVPMEWPSRPLSSGPQDTGPMPWFFQAE